MLKGRATDRGCRCYLHTGLAVPERTARLHKSGCDPAGTPNKEVSEAPASSSWVLSPAPPWQVGGRDGGRGGVRMGSTAHVSSSIFPWPPESRGTGHAHLTSSRGRRSRRWEGRGSRLRGLTPRLKSGAAILGTGANAISDPFSGIREN